MDPMIKSHLLYRLSYERTAFAIPLICRVFVKKQAENPKKNEKASSRNPPGVEILEIFKQIPLDRFRRFRRGSGGCGE